MNSTEIENSHLLTEPRRNDASPTLPLANLAMPDTTNIEQITFEKAYYAASRQGGEEGFIIIENTTKADTRQIISKPYLVDITNQTKEDQPLLDFQTLLDKKENITPQLYAQKLIRCLNGPGINNTVLAEVVPQILDRLPKDFPSEIRDQIYELYNLKLQSATGEVREDIENRHGIKISFDAEARAKSYRAQATNMYDSRSQLRCIESTAKILDEYPKGFFTRIGLDRVTIAETLKAFDGLAIGGSATNSEIFTFSDVNHSLHHEIAHVAAMRTATLCKLLNISSSCNREFIRDYQKDSYGRISGDDFSHGSEQFLRDSQNGEPLGDLPPDAPSHYGHTHASEHHAEVADRLFKDYTSLIADAERSPILDRAVKYVKEDYFRASQGRMDDQYWSDRLQKDIGSDYWDSREKRGDFNDTIWSKKGTGASTSEALLALVSAQNGDMKEAKAQLIRAKESLPISESAFKYIDQTLNYFDKQEARKVFVTDVMNSNFAASLIGQPGEICTAYQARIMDVVKYGSDEQKRSVASALNHGNKILLRSGDSGLTNTFLIFEDMLSNSTIFPFEGIATSPLFRWMFP